MMPDESFIEKQEASISPHIFSVSAGMVGACLTVISLLSLSSAVKKINTVGDDLTAFDALLFIGSCFLSYIAMKTKDRKRRLWLETAADRAFLCGLILMVVVCVLVVYSFSNAGAP